MSDDLLLDVIARSIGRTIKQENYRQRAADVLRSVKENDLTLPQPTNLIEHEITRLSTENETLRKALEFYGWEEHWVKQHYERSVIEDDRGRRARATLKGE